MSIKFAKNLCSFLNENKIKSEDIGGNVIKIGVNPGRGIDYYIEKFSNKNNAGFLELRMNCLGPLDLIPIPFFHIFKNTVTKEILNNPSWFIKANSGDKFILRLSEHSPYEKVIDVMSKLVYEKTWNDKPVSKNLVFVLDNTNI